METSLKAAEVLIPPQPDKPSSSLDTESSEGAAAAAPSSISSSDSFDPMEEFNRQLEDIVRTYGSAVGLLDRQSVAAPEMENTKEEAKGDTAAAVEKELALIMQSLNRLSTPEAKLQDLVRKYAELAALRRCDDQKLCALQQRVTVLLDERQQLQAERRSGVAARGKLETLCRELQSYYIVVREETLQRCREDEEKRSEITSHFQNMLTEIQTQIEQHSARNDKLCRENSHLSDKLESLMSQCERREESLEKINKHRDLQHKLTEAKLQQANALLAEAEEKHKREKEYLLREAIDKTKKCFAMKEQELAMKKKLTLYAQKFDEFQETLAKSNEIYVRFKKEMDNMSDKMKKMEKESNLWKTRFENCNKALTDMMDERAEKGKEYELFVIKIQKLEKLCRALQDERVVLYDKIKDVRRSHANIPSMVFVNADLNDPEDANKSALLSPEDLEELQQDPVLTEDMARLKEEQAKLREFAACLLATPVAHEEEEAAERDLEEDVVSPAFVQVKTPPEVTQGQVPDVKPEAAPSEGEEVPAPTPDAPTPEETTPETADPKPEEAKAVTQVQVAEVKPDPEVQQQQPVAAADTDPPPEAAKPEILEETGEVKPVTPEEEAQQQPAEPVQVPEEAPQTSESASSSKNKPQADSSKKQAPKKKKKRNGKSAS